MTAVSHPEVLSPEFVPPTLFGRERELEQIRRLLGSTGSDAADARVVLIRGPAGSGTSGLARLAARRALEEVRRAAGGVLPVLVVLRVPSHRGAQGLAAELVRRLDEGFEPRGFHTLEMLAGFLRRLNREGRAAIVVLDDVGPSAPDLTPFFRAFRHPDRFLPEGAERRIQTCLLVAGRSEALAVWSQAERLGIGPSHRIELGPYRAEELRTIVRDRATRALGHVPVWAGPDRVAARAYAEGGSVARALQLLRRELLGPEPRAPPTIMPGTGKTPVLSVEAHLIDVLESSLADHPTDLGEIRVQEIRRARALGRRPLPTTTLWRRILRLESAGLLRRTIRTGGPGGTRSTLELLRPVSEWPVRPGRYDTPLGAYVAPEPAPPGGTSGAAWSQGPPASHRSARPGVPPWGA